MLPGPAAGAADRPAPSTGPTGIAAPDSAARPAGAPVTPSAALPVARPTSTALGFSTLDGVLPTGSGLWVSHGGSVELVGGGPGVGPGAPLTLPGAGDLALSPAGDRLFVVSGTTGIAVFDTATWAAPVTWTTQPCPRHPAVLGDRLYYGYGCPGAGPYGIAALALTDGSAVTGTAAPLTDGLTAAPRLVSAGAVLVALEPGGSNTLHSYLREPDGTVTSMASVSPVDTIVDLALAPEPTELAVALGGRVRRLDTADLGQLQSVTPPGTPTAVGYGPDVDGFAVGISGSRTDQLQVRGLATGAVQSRSASTSSGTGPVNAAVLPGSLAYSDDGKLLRALVQPTGGDVILLTATALPVRPTVMTLRLTSPRRYVDPVRLRLLVRGRPNTPVRLVWIDADGRETKNVRTSSSGVVSLLLDAAVNGRIVATTAPDLTHGPGATAAGFTVPADFVVDLSGYSSIRGGVLRFRSFGRIRGLASGLPERQFAIQLTMQELTRRGWRSAAPAQPALTDGDGLLGITVGGFDRGVRYRLVVRFAGDRRNTGTVAFSRPFQVG